MVIESEVTRLLIRSIRSGVDKIRQDKKEKEEVQFDSILVFYVLRFLLVNIW